MATLNSLLDVDEKAVVELNAANLIRLCNPTAFVILLGDTTPLSPVLFDYGVNALAGTRVMDPDLALKCIGQGANFRQIKGTKRLTMMRPGTK